jgi:RNA polymerase sigma-70 factor (ECF subfamily)
MSPPTASGRRSAAGPEVDERALCERLRAGDRAAFAALVGRHGGSLLRLVSAIVKDRSAAEEVVQDTWLAALDGLDRFEGRSALRTWLFHIAVNKARTRLAREGRSVPFSALARPEDDDDAVDPARFDEQGAWRELPLPWTEEDPERLAQAAQTRAAIERAIAALPEAQRAVVTLRDLEGLEAEAICGLLGITVTNQRVLLHRARARIREALEVALADTPVGRPVAG